MKINHAIAVHATINQKEKDQMDQLQLKLNLKISEVIRMAINQLHQSNFQEQK